MCAGITWQPEAGNLHVAQMNAAQRHRGPDGAVVVRAGSATLGNTRLAIVEPTHAGDQPFVSSDGRITAVFNGEIYNYRELVSDYGLHAGGSDGAVIPQLYERFGVKAFRLLRGMWAIVLADERLGHTVLARDPYGIKPLYWRRCSHGLLAASEIKPLLDRDAAPSSLAIGRFLHLGAVPSTESPFADVHAVPPNTWVALTPNGEQGRGTVLPDSECFSSTVENLNDCAAEALVESVGLHLRSDVPSALLLSSGLDSGALAWAAQRNGQSLHCLTVDLGGGRSEAGAAATTAAQYGHSHQVVRRSPDAYDINSYFDAMQRPTIDGLNTFVVCRAVHQEGYKVALSGLGGDEATAGYSHHRMMRAVPAFRALARIPAIGEAVGWFLRRRRGELPMSKAEELLTARNIHDAWTLTLLQRRVWDAPLVRSAIGLSFESDVVGDSPLHPGSITADAICSAEYRLYLQRTLLHDADAFSMASSVELRVPMVDVRFVRAATSGAGKALGKEGLARLTGDVWLRELARRPKQGFSLPMDRWMRQGLLRARVEHCQTPEALVWRHVDREVGLRVLDAWRAGRVAWSRAWALVALDGWLTTLQT